VVAERVPSDGVIDHAIVAVEPESVALRLTGEPPGVALAVAGATVRAALGLTTICTFACCPTSEAVRVTVVVVATVAGGVYCRLVPVVAESVPTAGERAHVTVSEAGAGVAVTATGDAPACTAIDAGVTDSEAVERDEAVEPDEPDEPDED